MARLGDQMRSLKGQVIGPCTIGENGASSADSSHSAVKKRENKREFLSTLR